VAFLAPAAAAALLLSLIGASVAFATHPTPLATGALQQTSGLVPAMQVCGAGGGTPNGSHDGPIQVASCSGAQMKALSNFLKIGPKSTTTNSTLPAPGNRGALIQVINPSTASEDVKVQATSTDVRCKTNTSVTGHCPGPANTTGTNDYDGQVLGFANIRITDTCNSGAAANACGTTHATVQDLPFSIGIQCAGTPTDATKGGTCAVSTTVNTVVPDGPFGAGGGGPAVKNGKKAAVQIDGLRINDAGSDGVLTIQNPFSTASCSGPTISCIASPSDTLLSVQGIFIP